MSDRFNKIEGVDYKKGAREYADKLEPSDRHHLYTKPFYNLKNKISRWTGDGLDEDTQRHFIDFANIAAVLSLPAGATVLDVGCGSGWLSEYFARFGYRVTGIDISPDLIRIAKDRIDKLPFGMDDKSPVVCEFLAHDIELKPLDRTFDAIVCYDSLHHFEDEHAVLTNLNLMLANDGWLFVAEGERPPSGSQSEAELVEVMEKFDTLESPFSRDYLLKILADHGFVVVGDYASVTGFVDRDNIAGNEVSFIETPSFNYLLCKKMDAKTADSREPSELRCKFELRSDWATIYNPGSPVRVTVEVENTGDTIWLVSRAPLKGRVRVGLKILNAGGEVVEEIHGWPRIQKAVSPGESVTLDVTAKAPLDRGEYILKVDLLDQDICWFEQHGSQPLSLPFIVR
jgi:2-polyprenyl-3-methyl-5-hydroxy-6-metoxy-1,4-benzoquinol methylase